MVLIPSDAGLNLRQPGDTTLQPIARVPGIPADLPDLRQGQNFTATIQQVLPENTYLALVAGKSVTLSLPGAAKAGDTLELVVVDRTTRGFIAQLAGQSAAQSAELAQGQSFTASILEVLPGNMYKALVDGKPVTLQLDLPANAGDQLELQLVGRTPELITAQLARPGDVANLYQYTSLSRAGQMIGALLVPEGETPTAAPLNRGQPLLTQPPVDAQQLAPALASAVGQSGLFYEAHQAQWVAGRLPLASLLQEPQGRHAAAGDQATTANTVPADLRPLVQQQLDAVATQRLIWQGQVWPGQTMNWQIERKPEGRGHEEEAEQRWATTLSLTTPRLGQVQAALNLSGGGVRIALTATASTIAADLAAAAPALEQALAAAGVPLTGFTVGTAAGVSNNGTP